VAAILAAGVAEATPAGVAEVALPMAEEAVGAAVVVEAVEAATTENRFD
jgi:hypothetical protein